MNLLSLVEKYLEREPKARERRNKDRALVNLLMERYPELQNVKKETLISAVQDFNSMDRYWRLTLKNRKDLRGQDYEDKAYYEQREKISLGYESGYVQLKGLFKN
jgi:hypothetical protein